MTKLNQIIAVEQGVKSLAYSGLTKTHQQLQKAGLLSGLARTYAPIDDDGERYPDESTKVQLKVDEVLADTAAELTRLFDVVATKDWGNTVAKASVKVGDKVLIKDVPVTYLLFLEKQLKDLKTFIEKLPVLDPAEQWQRDANADTWATVPAKTTKTKKILRNHVMYEATKEHPAQVQVFPEDVVVGYWTSTKFSGALPGARVNELLDRVTELQNAVKYAREEANSTVVDDQRVGKAFFDYLFA